MKAAETHKLSDEELKVEADRLCRHLYELKSQAVTEKLEDPSQIGKTRKDIARMKTVLRQRELEEQKNNKAK